MAWDKWDEDEVGYGVGMLFEVDGPRKTKPLSKRSPKNRHQRPQSEWTPNDVAAEFRARIESAVPALTGFVTGKNNGLMVAATRQRLRTTADVELALMEIFLIEPREIAAITKAPHMAFRMWIATWPRNMNRARDMVGLPPLGAPEASESLVDASVGTGSQPSSYEGSVGSLVASDGTEFPDTPLGRRRLAKYEESE